MKNEDTIVGEAHYNNLTDQVNGQISTTINLIGVYWNLVFMNWFGAGLFKRPGGFEVSVTHTIFSGLQRWCLRIVI